MTADDRAPNPLLGIALIAASSAGFGIVALIARDLGRHMSAAQIVLSRSLFGLLGVAVLLACRRGELRMQRPWLLSVRGLTGGAGTYLYTVAIIHLGIGAATVLNYCAPCYAMLLGALFLGERPPRLLIAGVLVALLGAAIVILASAGAIEPANLGVGTVSGIAASIAGGASFVTIRSLKQSASPLAILLSFFVFSAVVAVPQTILAWRPVDVAVVLPSVLALGALAFGGQIAMTQGFSHVSATTGSGMTLLTPIFAWVFSMAFGWERIRLWTAAGALTCLIGIAAVMLGSRITQSRAAEPTGSRWRGLRWIPPWIRRPWAPPPK
jgi:drug/metabolite transporter (DMT)-like permease